MKVIVLLLGIAALAYLVSVTRHRAVVITGLKRRMQELSRRYPHDEP